MQWCTTAANAGSERMDGGGVRGPQWMKSGHGRKEGSKDAVIFARFDFQPRAASFGRLLCCSKHHSYSVDLDTNQRFEGNQRRRETKTLRRLSWTPLHKVPIGRCVSVASELRIAVTL